MTGFASSLTYHPNGLLHRIDRPGPVFDVQENDLHGMARPLRLRTTGASEDFDTGDFGYDGAGNVMEMGSNRFRYDLLSRVVEAEVSTVPETCGEDLVLESHTFTTTTTEEVCGEIETRQDVTVASTAEVTFRAGDRIVLGDGFRVESGGRFAAEVDPDLLPGGADSEATWEGEYDLFGNLTSITTQRPGQSAKTRTPKADPATNRLAAVGTAYDLSGNVEARLDWEYSYDPFNMPWQAKRTGGNGFTFVYGPGDERLWTVDWTAGTGTQHWVETWTLRDLDGRPLRQLRSQGGNTKVDNWSFLQDYVWRGGGLLGAFTRDGIRYTHLDHLGTPRLLTDPNGATHAYHAYFPFGEEATSPTDSIVPLQYTGHERDDLDPGASTSADLDYMHARYFSAHLGRFHSLDPVGADPTWPQSWNRYSYVLGNPMKYTDPRGLYWSPALVPFDDIPVETFFDSTVATGSLFSFSPGSASIPFRGPTSWSSFGFSLFGSSGSGSGTQRATLSRPTRCGTAPQGPPGVDIERNLALVGLTQALFGPDDSALLVIAASAPGSIWDFKAQHKAPAGTSYEDFGNFHFGAASAAAGIPRGIALRGAGLVQITFSRTQSDWLYSQGPTLLPGWNPPFGDDPRDQQQIRLGYFWYENCL